MPFSLWASSSNFDGSTGATSIFQRKSTEKNPKIDPLSKSCKQSLKGRKRHILVDHLGLLISAQVSAGNTGDRAGLQALLYYTEERKPIQIYVDQGYKGKDFEEEIRKLGIEVVVVPRRKTKSFTLAARRWIVERTFAWLGKYRRLAKDYELVLSSSFSMIYITMIRLMVKWIAKAI